MADPSFFRHLENSSDGQKLSITKKSSTLWIYTTTLSFITCFLWLTQYNYTRKMAIQGIVQSSAELVRVYPHQAGIITRAAIQENVTVAAGSIMFEINSERQQQLRSVESRVADLLDQRLALLKKENQQQSQLYTQQSYELQQRQRRCNEELANTRHEISLLQQRLVIANEAVQKHKTLAAEGFVSIMQVQQHEATRLNVEQQLNNLFGQILRLQKEQEQVASQIRLLPLQQATRKTELSRGQNALRQEQLTVSAQQKLAVIAPVAATVSAITARLGQYVTPQQSLATLLPANAPLEVHLYAPSRSVGFVHAGAKVKLRYEAFPYQKFGHAEGTIINVSRTPLLPSEISSLPNAQEALYRIRVKLKKSHIQAYGQNVPLQVGMRLEADVQLDTRPLYEWALEPLFSVSGKI